MSLSGATRAFGSSIIDGSYLDAGWAAPGGGHLFTGSRTPGKGCAAPAAPRKCALLGAQSGPEGHDRTVSPSVGPGEANFFPYLSIQLPPVGDHLLGLGITAFVWLGKCGR